MECLFINLDKDIERRASVERNFADVTMDGWWLTRYPALDKEDMDRWDVKGNVSPAEKACFLSHRSLVQSKLYKFEPILVVEDDVVFHPETFAIIDQLMTTLPLLSWDLIFLDICAPDPKLMIDLYWAMRTRPNRRQFALMDLKTMSFAGSTSYIVNGRSKHKLSRLLDRQGQIDIPYDIYLRDLVWKGQLDAFVIFPFVSTLSGFADVSTIKEVDAGSSDRAWNLFRRFMWIGRDLDAQREAVSEQFAAVCDEETRAIAMMLGSVLSGDPRGTLGFPVLTS